MKFLYQEDTTAAKIAEAAAPAMALAVFAVWLCGAFFMAESLSVRLNVTASLDGQTVPPGS